MTFERAQSSFRAAVLHEGGSSLVVKDKKPRGDRSAPALTGQSVPRRDYRHADMRSGDRHRLTDAGATVRKGRRTIPVDVINISGGGAMVDGPLNAKLWQTVTLVLGDVGEVECAVRWIRDDRYGLEFAHETKIDCDPAVLNELLRKVLIEASPEDDQEEATSQEASEPTASEPRRTAQRHPLIWSGIIQFNHESVVGRLRNISATGAQVQSTASCSVGSEVVLDLGNAGALPATVRWLRGDQMGIAFHESFDVQKLAKVKPEVAARNWLKPEYLEDESAATSPWASQWGRLTVQDLKRTLFR